MLTNDLKEGNREVFAGTGIKIKLEGKRMVKLEVWGGDRKQKTENRRQKTEDRRQKTEDSDEVVK